MFIFQLLELPVHNSEIRVVSRRFGPTDLPGGLYVCQRKQNSEMSHIYKAGTNDACGGHSLVKHNYSAFLTSTSSCRTSWSEQQFSSIKLQT
jgi:queuine/archaeosine tRNA-ribosyltransferase